MQTFIYMIRHGESPKEGNERTRGLTEKGKLAAERIKDRLKAEGIDAIISSPYYRSILTVQPLADSLGQEVFIFEDLRERVFSSDAERVPDQALNPLLERSFSDFNFALEGGESNAGCQKRAVNVLQDLLITYRGKKVVIGTHGAVMTLMMGYYDSYYDLDFLHRTSKPDIYRMTFDDQKLVGVKRIGE
ncbi:2,3-bisphosphoglycerate-dependent phosphoglycerate mutase [Pullulanibacillus pueri]|uniref:Phosphoglycerate mutase n=1 Tax=Pullulanibacillus pueri TaxID=1437324 RepID=A0A8J3A0L7_9BACL|nr:histidine phosphatase family protein [Pullulanibacillus pueri]MBM7682022.1 2,3-bisphosphoglycerate-dependent phosphoglycerate mutase [Pullulanibacillus pueri]GGH88249.1 phosphoglycerate mutase [Pullulanibacillus pueri]